MCESNTCFYVTELDGMVNIVSDDPDENCAVDTMEAWIVFRDDIKAGKYDHIGQGA